jgi:hypothetical protein
MEPHLQAVNSICERNSYTSGSEAGVLKQILIIYTSCKHMSLTKN